MKIEEKILLEENELKPNRYIANAMLCMAGVIVVVELINELDIFHVVKSRMRLCCLIVLLCTAIAQAIGRTKLAERPMAKYYIMTLILAESLAATVMVAQWTELVIAFPLLLCIQYHNRKVTSMAVAGGLAIAIVAAPLSAYLRIPQVEFYTFLIRNIGFEIGELHTAAQYDRAYYLYSLFKYVSLPRTLMVAAYWPVAMHITDLASGNVRSRADATYYSSVDIMTGLLNRFSFEAKVDQYRQDRPAQLLCVYADADGLHALNNAKGHAAGDALLKTIAAHLSAAFGELTYRIGGDEFLAFLETGTEEEALAAIEGVKAALAEEKYHASIGVSCLEEDMDIDVLVKEAENRMYEAKRKYYTEFGHDRRRNR